MAEIIYYILELVKFMVIYRLGLSMKLTKNHIKQTAVFLFVILMGALENVCSLSIFYPLLYTAFVFLIFFLLVEDVAIRYLVFVFFAMAVVFFVDTISYVLVRRVLHVQNFQLDRYQNLCASAVTVLILAVLFGIMSYKHQTAMKELSVWYFIAFLVICAVNASVLVLIGKKLQNQNGEFTYVYIMLTFSSLVQMAFVFVLASANRRHRKNEEMQKQYLEMQARHYQYLEEKNLATQKFRHDMRAHMYVLKQYIIAEQWEELGSYIDTICEKLEYIPGYLSIKNGIVDSILNYYNKQFTENGCKFQVMGNMPQKCYVEAYDLCVIFSNILSNALEYTINVENKMVVLSVHFDDGIIYIRERNTYEGSLKRNGNEIMTTKSDKGLHGFGIHNIEESVEKYGGYVTIDIINDEFVLDIVMENCKPHLKMKKSKQENYLNVKDCNC